MMTECEDAKVGQFSFYTFQRVSISAGRLRRCKGRSVQLLHVSESEYKAMAGCADRKPDLFSFYTFQRVSIKCCQTVLMQM